MLEKQTNIPVSPADPVPAIPIDVAELSVDQQNLLTEAATKTARSAGWLPGKSRSTRARELLNQMRERFLRLEGAVRGANITEESPEDLRVLHDNMRLLQTTLAGLQDAVRFLGRLPPVRSGEEVLPRPLLLARALAASTESFRLSVPAFSLFVEGVQSIQPLLLGELWGMLPALQMVLLDKIVEAGWGLLGAGDEPKLGPRSIDRMNLGLRLLGDLDWKPTLESLSYVHRILLADPAGIYGRMDYESRERYRQQVEKIARRSDVSEIELAERLVKEARNARVDSGTAKSLADRLRHVGFYLVDEPGGRRFLERIGWRPAPGRAIELFFHRFPDEVYILGIEVITLVTTVALIMSLVQHHTPLGLLFSGLLLLVPATQAAVELMNYLATVVITPRPLAKLDFSKRVDPAFSTMVAIPTLLINERQIHQLVDDLEVRYLVNRDPHICYALLTDLPDSAEPTGDRDDRIDLAIRLIDDLNKKYSDEGNGGFYLFHRHRVYNPREGAWMGWERKRGKLLDLNQMLRGVYDPFPVKAGDISRLPFIRFVLTLDSDTQLPRGSAQRLIGAMAHPLNRALVDSELNIVTMGYGILQPRVGISVHSATRSRLASIYSGQTGFDIYSRAVSDVYQDLYGEGIFTGKGIYDVDTLRAVLERRFPRNALLSHDLIEGAYARAGLVSDIEVIDDYPSHYSAYNRRRHRWLRGDWQIARWVFGRVPDESGRLVSNPISLISKWKILDNLRRSLVEPATFALLVAGWFVLPGGPRFWTLTTLALLFLPIYFRLIFSTFKAIFTVHWEEFRQSFLDFLTAHVNIFLNIAFLAHQSLVSLDAVVRTIVRSTITHSRLLEWETATEAELGIRKRTPVDLYLDWIPVPALLLAIALYWKPEAAPYAIPFLLAWTLSKLISNWLNRSPHPEDFDLRPIEVRFLRDVALRTWQYFNEFSSAKNGWLIPDNVQLEPYRIAERLSPTNYGLLLNARQAAYEFGYITLTDFADLTSKSLDSALGLERMHGHFYNWYDNLTRQPLEPRFLSSVDSGNLVASLWCLEQGCLEMIQRPLLTESAREGFDDLLEQLANKKSFRALKPLATASNLDAWLKRLLQSTDLPNEVAPRVSALKNEVEQYAPWLLPEFEGVQSELKFSTASVIPGKADAAYNEIEGKLRAISPGRTDVQALLVRLAGARSAMRTLVGRLSNLASQAEALAGEMRFDLFVNPDRQLLSIGWDAVKDEQNKSCYDLLASESRTATFIAVAKGDTRQESWFRLGRTHTLCEGESVLISWTGTMFEYLMPAIWERSHPNTLLDRTTRAAVRAHKSFGDRNSIPWGISEAAFSERDADGNYQYHAFGLAGLALSVARKGSLVISPYASCLALLVDPAVAVENLLRMARMNWIGDYGFFESADYTGTRRPLVGRRQHELVRCWMAHHQGMSLAAICNVLNHSPFQRWFHAEPVVQASDLILQERPLRTKPIADDSPKRLFNFGRNPARNLAVKARV